MYESQKHDIATLAFVNLITFEDIFLMIGLLIMQQLNWFTVLLKWT